jgi:hypothetical protein
MKPRMMTAISMLTGIAALAVIIFGFVAAFAAAELDEHAYRAVAPFMIGSCLLLTLGIVGLTLAVRLSEMNRWVYWAAVLFHLSIGITCGFIFLPKAGMYIAGFSRFYGFTTVFSFLSMVGTFVCPAIALYMVFASIRQSGTQKESTS